MKELIIALILSIPFIILAIFVIRKENRETKELLRMYDEQMYRAMGKYRK